MVLALQVTYQKLPDLQRLFVLILSEIQFQVNCCIVAMSPLPVVYGTVGRIESLLDPSIYGRFADLPQNGKRFISSRTKNFSTVSATVKCMQRQLPP